jgi:hypothetical protein
LLLEDLLIGEVYESKIVTARQKSFTQCTSTPADNSKKTQERLKKNLIEVWEKEI